MAIGLFVASCKPDYLETIPTGSVDASAAYATTKNASAAINGIYRAMVVRYLSAQTLFGHPAMMIIMDVMGEDLVFGNTSNTGHFNEQRWVSHRSETGALSEFAYLLYYRLIGNANIAIASIDNATGTQAERNQIKGEALGLRAFSYFNLVQLYGKRYDAAVSPTANWVFHWCLPPLPKDYPAPQWKMFTRRSTRTWLMPLGC